MLLLSGTFNYRLIEAYRHNYEAKIAEQRIYSSYQLAEWNQPSHESHASCYERQYLELGSSILSEPDRKPIQDGDRSGIDGKEQDECKDTAYDRTHLSGNFQKWHLHGRYIHDSG